jgi:hypothetical protein
MKLRTATQSYGGTTATGYVETSEGMIAHLRLVTPYGMLDAPVRIVPGLVDTSGAPVPYRTAAGQLVFALPGGQVMV